ncbi:ATP synthase F1 subunit delta [Acholeplasma granularum]|uniref:ATP synthase F1 subunit delta n=1 Tax=Acholeplasma granularum TaxID=264635 RepID=UPI0004B06FB3|nr:ATP synthase F1 subunit delta [Acholeplasma granularum]
MISTIYSDALFKLALKEDAVESIIEQYETFVALASDNPDWIIFLDSPMVRNKVKQKLLTELGVFNELFINFLMLLIRHHQIRYYETIYEQWNIKSRLHQKIAYVQLYTAKPLSKSKLAKLKAEIEDYLPGLDIEFNIHIDPSLISGEKIIYQGRSIERSFKKSLDDMRANI